MNSLRPAQVDAISKIYSKSKLLLADVGAGKTATAARAITTRRLIYGPARTLVLGTVRICDTVWGPELEAWAPHFSYASVAKKKADERRAIMEDPSIDVVGLNFDNLIWAIETYKDELPKMFPQLIVDECSKLENPASKSFRALNPYLPAFEWRLPMTGTPQANYYHDLWGSAYLADLGAALGKHKEAFLQYFFHPVRRRTGIGWIPKHGAPDLIQHRLTEGGVIHRMPFEWHKPVELDILLPLNPVVRKILDLIDARLHDDESTVTIDGITFARDGNRVHGKMLQLASGFIYDDEKNVIHLHSDKLFALSEIVAEAHGEPMMVIFQFDHERDAIFEHFPQARLLDTNETLREWNAGKIEMLLAHPRSCGHGLNAQLSGCDLQVWFTPNPDAELYTQTVGRLNRPGNPKTIRVFRLIMQGTKDKATYNVIAARQRSEQATLSMYE